MDKILKERQKMKQYHSNSILKLPEAAEYMNISKTKLRELVVKGIVLYTRLTPNGQYRFRVKDLDELVETLFSPQAH